VSYVFPQNSSPHCTEPHDRFVSTVRHQTVNGKQQTHYEWGVPKRCGAWAKDVARTEKCYYCLESVINRHALPMATESFADVKRRDQFPQSGRSRRKKFLWRTRFYLTLQYLEDKCKLKGFDRRSIRVVGIIEELVCGGALGVFLDTSTVGGETVTSSGTDCPVTRRKDQA